VTGSGSKPVSRGRAFSANMLPPGQSASGFFYFQSGFAWGWNLSLSGLEEADTRQASLYCRPWRFLPDRALRRAGRGRRQCGRALARRYTPATKCLALSRRPARWVARLLVFARAFRR
jgi:hypothetical protein